MTETTERRDLGAILADLADFTVASTGARAISLYHELEDALRARLVPLPEGEAERLAEAAERAARTMAPPVPGVTANAGYTVRAVICLHPHQNGLLESWAVACEDPERGVWATWTAYALDHPGRIGQLAYDTGHYFDMVSGPSGLGRADNKRRALADLAIRAGLMSEIGLRIADEITRYHDLTGPYTTGRTEDRRMARRLRKWCSR